MKRYVIFPLVLLTAAICAQRAYSQTPGEVLCPTVAVSCPDAATGHTLRFTANLPSASPSARSLVTFNWTVSAEKITRGQGKPLKKCKKSGGEAQHTSPNDWVGGGVAADGRQQTGEHKYI